MIFIAFFLFIAIIAMSLSMFNSSNLDQIETHLQNENCSEYVYSKGSYKALCEDRILEVSNSFIVDLEKNSIEYKYSDIKNIDVQNLDILINDQQKISFKKKDELYEFYDKLKKKIKK